VGSHQNHRIGANFGHKVELTAKSITKKFSLHISDGRFQIDNNVSSSFSSWDKLLAVSDVKQSTLTTVSLDITASASTAADDDDDLARCLSQSARVAVDDIKLKSLTHCRLSNVAEFGSWSQCADVTLTWICSRWRNLSTAAALKASISDFCQTHPQCFIC